MGDGKPYSRGREDQNLSECDIVDRYVLGLQEELDECSIRHSICPTRKPPGVTLKDRGTVFPHTLVLSCAVGWLRPGKAPQSNISRVFYGQKEAGGIAKDMALALGAWGNIYTDYGHRSANAFMDPDDPVITGAGAWGLRLEPFAINGPHAIEYAKRLENLGRDIGRVVTDYLMLKDEGRNKPSSLATWVPRTT